MTKPNGIYVNWRLLLSRRACLLTCNIWCWIQVQKPKVSVPQYLTTAIYLYSTAIFRKIYQKTTRWRFWGEGGHPSIWTSLSHIFLCIGNCPDNESALPTLCKNLWYASATVHEHHLVNYHPQTKLRKGNVFTSVCKEFCPQGGMHGGGTSVVGLCVPGGHA